MVYNEDIEKHAKLWKLCERFIREQRISCAETIYQTDWVVVNSYELIEEICNIVGYVPTEELEAPVRVERTCTDSKSAASPLRQEAEDGPTKGT